MTTTTHKVAHHGPQPGPTAGDVRIADLSHDSLIIRLHFTITPLARWLSPIHDRERMDRSSVRGQPSVKELLIAMREEERRVFPMLYLMATQNNPDLDKLSAPAIS